MPRAQSPRSFTLPALFTLILIAAALVLGTRSVSAATLVGDINATGSSQPQGMTGFNGQMYFSAVDQFGDHELWRHDPATGSSVKFDLNANGSSSALEFTVAGSNLFFTARDDSGDHELWVIRQGEEFAEKIDINAQTSSYPASLVAGEDRVFFAATGETAGRELWMSDGTIDGTAMVDDANVAGSSNPFKLTYAVGHVYFFGIDNTGNTGLFVSDVAHESISQLKLGDYPNASPVEMTSLNENVVISLSYTTESGGGESFPVPANTVLLASPDGAAPVTLDPYESQDPNALMLTEVNGLVYFVGTSTTGYNELFVTDGTPGGTYEISTTNINGSGRPSGLTNLNGRLVYAASDSASDRELWMSDGVETVRLEVNTRGSANPSNLALIDGKIYFSATDAAGDTELWVTDGSAAGTAQVANAGDNFSSDPRGFASVRDVLYFAGNDSESNLQLYYLDSADNDADKDGISNDIERRIGTDPFTADPDSDADGTADPIDARPANPDFAGPDVLLDRGVVDTNRYGGGFDGAQHGNLVRMRFDNPGVDMRLILSGYDINNVNDAVVYLVAPERGTYRLGALQTGATNQLGAATNFTINHSLLAQGENFIEIRQRDAGSRWGVQNARLTTLRTEVTALQYGAQSRKFGWRYGSDAHPYIFRGSFDGTGRDMVIAMAGYDVDNAIELQLVVNGTVLGNLPVTGNGKTSDDTIFRIPRDLLSTTGKNIVEVVQTQPIQSWGIWIRQIR